MRPAALLTILLMALVSTSTGAQSEPTGMRDADTQQAIALMMRFAERTGLSSGRPPQRYLWTDAFAVCNFLGLARATGEPQYRELALRLVDQVHHTLGRHRDDDARRGWISGLSESEGEAHPTRGGLRIGKALPERGVDEPFDERLEWDRDGQYFHYLSKWMHALDQVARATGQASFNRWARELAASSFEAFSYLPYPGAPARRMRWKMSIDLTRALVPSMGQHDPLEGYITAVQLRAAAAPAGNGPSLQDEIRGFGAMIRGGDWASADPLGIGGLLVDAYRVAQLSAQGTELEENLLKGLLSASLAGLQYYARSDELQRPADYRLAFRELGLAIGLRAMARLWHAATRDAEAAAMSPAVRTRLRALSQYAFLGDSIVSFWRDPAQQGAAAWTEHRDINEVMLATSLAPDGFLLLRQPVP